jgi:predicted alpha/beta hydrolase family esterase
MKIELNVNGILTFPGDSQGWTDRAVTHAHLEFDLYAEKLENFTPILTRVILQERRARFVARIANKYIDHGWTVYLRGHSNGCDIIRRALFHIKEPIKAAQLIAPAVEPDFEKNGFNQLLRDGCVERLLVCWGPNDEALRWAKWSHPVLNLFGNAYGIMGMVGPQNVAPDVKHLVTSIANVHFGHNDWVHRDHLLNTMRLLHATGTEAEEQEPDQAQEYWRSAA